MHGWMDTFWHIVGALEAIFIILILWISFDFWFMKTVLFFLVISLLSLILFVLTERFFSMIC